MKIDYQGFRCWSFALIFVAIACNDNSSTDVTKHTGPSAGNFQVSLVATGPTEGYTSIVGQIYTGPNPSAILWKEVGTSGNCRILTPTVPFCDPVCGSGAACVEDGKCQLFPKTMIVGKVTVKGLHSKSGSTNFTMSPGVLDSYQPPSGTELEYPPFAEGDAVTFSASGDTGISAFTITGKAISPLHALHDSLPLATGKPILLEWTPAKNQTASIISVLVDISHHGGSKGKIECEGPDNGQLEIAATLVDQLKALGVSGFPKVEITRKAISTNTDVQVDLVIESQVVTPLSIPGLVSCFENKDCPDGQTCQDDLQCK